MDSPSEEEVKLEVVSTEHLREIVAYCEHYNYTEPPPIPKPLPTADLKAHVQAYDYELV